MRKTKNSITLQKETQLLNAAKAGNTDARDELYFAYSNEIEIAHTYSAVGKYPARFGKCFNPRGLSYEEDCGRLFLIFDKAIKSFCPLLYKKSSEHPFLDYLKTKIRQGAFDALISRTYYRDELRSFSQMSHEDKEFFHNPTCMEDLLEEAANCGIIRNNNLVNSYCHDMERLANEVLLAFPKESEEFKTVATLLKALNYEEKVIPELARQLSVSKPTAYKRIATAKAKLPRKLAEQIREFLVA